MLNKIKICVCIQNNDPEIFSYSCFQYMANTCYC